MNWRDGIDISIPYTTAPSASAWYVGPVRIEPVRANGFVGSVMEGGSVNFKDISFNPHGHGTHTECVGHIAPECYSVNQHLKRWMFDALLVSVTPQQKGEDWIIPLADLQNTVGSHRPEAIVLRTLPNETEKRIRSYSNSNPPYIEAEAARWLCEIGVLHLLIDLPSVDRESDGGALAAHRAFWNYPSAPRMEATITEFIYVPNEVADGPYLLNLQVAPFENDAAPSRPVLYSK